MIGPRILSVPPCSRSLGSECVAWARAAGWLLDEWQAFVIEGMLGLGEDDRFVSFEDGLNVARQNGKGVVLQVVEAFAAFELGYRVVMHTAHEFATSQEHQLRLEGMIQDASHLHARVRDKGGYVHANGQESIRLKSGARIIFKARTKGGGRGYSGDLLVWDEAMVIPETVVGAQFPMQRASVAKHGPKVIYAGSAVDQEVHDYGVPWARLRQRGMAGEPGIAYFEWSAPFEHPSVMTEELLLDRSWWPQANPALGIRIDPEHMEREIRSMAARTAAVELAGVGDWPRTDGLADTVIAIDAWDALEDEESRLQPPYCVAFDVSPERRTSIAFAGRNLAGDFHVEIQEHRAGTGWVVARLVEILERVEVEVVVCDAVGPAGSLIVPLEEAGVKVETVNTTEHGQACGRLVDMVSQGTLAHLGSAELRDAVRGSKARTLGDAWAWSRRSSLVDISPLVAATLALGAAAGVAAATDWSIY